MKTPDFRNMSSEYLDNFRPKTEAEFDAYRQESEFRDWCKDFDDDAFDSGARERYKEWREETNPEKFFESLDENDRAGWEDNITKD